jgi:hypothetical protein
MINDRILINSIDVIYGEHPAQVISEKVQIVPHKHDFSKALQPVSEKEEHQGVKLNPASLI